MTIQMRFMNVKIVIFLFPTSLNLGRLAHFGGVFDTDVPVFGTSGTLGGVNINFTIFGKTI